MTNGIQVKNLQSTSSISNTAQLMALTDAQNNTVNLISKPNLAQSLVSTTANNGLTSDANGLFVVNTGQLSSLQTSDKSSLVAAINENNSKIGNLNSLQTSTKTNLVAAINENATKIKQPVTSLSSSGTVALADNSVNTITPTGNVSFTLPTVITTNIFHQILVQVNLPTYYYISFGTTYYFNEEAPDLSATGKYDLIYEYDLINSFWVVGAIKKG